MNQNSRGKKSAMQIFRFFENQDFIINKKFFLNQQNIHKIISVLRLQLNDVIYLFNNTNREFAAKITNITTTKPNKSKIKVKIIEIEILQAINKNLESPLKIHLAQAIAKHDNMDWIIQKAIELGVHSITPIITKRTIVKITTEQIQNKTLHWQSIAVAACCQCGRNIVPSINPIIYFDDFINLVQKKDFDNKFILSPNFDLDSKDLDKNKINISINIDPKQEIILVVGPEGGFSTEELTIAKKNQFSPLTIGPRVLRTETAPLVALSILQSKYGDL